MSFRTNAHARALWLFLVAVPVSVGLTLTAPLSLSTAYGCSGGSTSAYAGAPDGWYGVVLEKQGVGAAPADAALVFRGRVMGWDDATALGAVTITLKDAGGTAVAGTTELIGELGTEAGIADFRNVALVWRPSAPLTVGGTYQVSWAAGSSSGSDTLTVAAAAEPAPPASLETPQLIEALAMSGPLVSCDMPHPCGYGTIGLTLHQSTSKEKAISIQLQPAAAVNNATYQMFELAPVTGKGTPAAPSQRAVVVAAPGVAPSKTSLWMAFADEPGEYCVTLTTTDLRSGAQTGSSELCVDSSGNVSSAPTLWESMIGSCLELPHPDLLDIWCEHNAEAAECGGPGGVGGSTGIGGSVGTGAAGAGSAGSPAGSAADGSSSGGCTLAAIGERPAAQWLLGLLLALGCLRRRSTAK